MSGWPLLSLNSVASVFNGKTPSKSDQRNDGHPVLKIKDVSAEGKFRGKFESFVETSFSSKYASKLLRSGDSLILNAAHNASHVASKTYFAESEVLGALVTGEWLVIRPDSSTVDPRFVYHWLSLPRTKSDLRELINGIHLYPKDVALLKIPTPPLKQQQRIADILDQAHELRFKRRQAISMLDNLDQSVFLNIFGGSGDSGVGWEVVPLGEISEVQGGLQVTSKRSSLPVEMPYLRVANVYRNHLDLGEIKKIRLTERELERTSLEKGDLLVVEGHGNPNEIGRVAMWDGSINPCVHQNHLIRVRIDSRAMPAFMVSLLNSTHGRMHLLRSANTTSGLNTISTSDVRATPVMLPPIEKQAEYVRCITQINQTRSTMQDELVMLDELFDSLQAKAFRGDL